MGKKCLKKCVLDRIDPFILAWMLSIYAMTMDDNDNAKRRSNQLHLEAKIVDFHIQIRVEH